MKYEVDITRHSCSTITIEVDAPDEATAADIALEMAENEVFDEEDCADYEVNAVYEC